MSKIVRFRADNFESNAYDFFKIMVVVHLILYIPINFVVMRYR